MSKLKPCPFCGGKAELEATENSFGESVFHVFCTNWKCVSSTKHYKNKLESIKAWNRRSK